MSEPFDQTVDLIRAARNGDRDALATVAGRYREPLLERIRLMMGAAARDAAESDDFFQGLFVEIIRDFDRLDRCDERSFLRWATGIARNNIRDEVRRRRECALDHFASSIDWRPFPGTDAPRSPPAAAAHLEQIDRVIDAMTQLPPGLRRVIELRDFDGLPFAEIATHMNRSDNAAQLLHHRALIRLGGLLREE